MSDELTATDELRRLLDERDVEYRDYFHANKTWWSDRENVGWYAEDRPSTNGLYVKIEAVLTPKQAVEATLGHRECRLEEIEKDCDTASEYMLDREFCFDAVYRCSCGCRFGHVAHERPKFCPSCGCKIKED